MGWDGAADGHARAVDAERDPVIAALDDAARAVAGLKDAVDPLLKALTQARASRHAGVPLPEVVAGLVEAGGRELRLTPSRACRELERSLTTYRAVAIRELVDEDGLTFTEIAKLTGVSRQMVGRLYRSA
jgi:hypothetical protein